MSARWLVLFFLFPLLVLLPVPRVATASGRVATASGRVATVSGTVATASGTVATASGRVATASGTVATASGTVATASGTVATASGTVPTASGRTRVVAPSGPYITLAEALEAAEPGDTVEVRGGTHAGPVVVDKPLTLVGVAGAVLDGGGAGTVLTVAAPRVTVRGFTIRGSGAKLEREDAGVLLTHAPDCLLEANRVEDVLFGVTVAQSPRCTLRGNTIIGKPLEIARRGDGLRVWESPGTLVEGNHLSTGRDLLLWYSDGTTLRGNTVETGRYGLHFMFNHQTTVEENILRDNSVGIYLMYSDHITITRNSLLANRGPSGYGLGLKEVSDVRAEGNLFLDNRVGVYLDNAPLDPTLPNWFEGNSFAFNDTGLAFLPQVKNNHFVGNNFIENGQQLAIEGSGAFGGNQWSDPVRGGNYWSDYAGYDADKDGRGDLPYRNESLFERLMDRQPALRLFLLSPAGQAVDLAARAFPIVAPQPRLTDEVPLMAPVPAAAAPRPPVPSPWPLRLASLTLLLLGVGGMVGSTRRTGPRGSQGISRWFPVRLKGVRS